MLRNKTILIISPEAWGEHLLSKHHYARALAEMGNNVFFLNPPNSGSHVKMCPIEGLPSLSVLNYQGMRGVRFLPRFLRKWAFKWEAAKLISLCGVPFDIVWSFDNSRLYDLNAFGECSKIAHVMDEAVDFHTEEHARSADLCLAVTPSILERMINFNSNTHLIPHGYAEVDFQRTSESPTNQVAAYSGNVLLKYINRPLVQRLVNENSSVEFHFYGAIGKSNIGKMHEGDQSFIDFLKHAPNVTLHGTIQRNRLLQNLANARVLLMFYDTKKYAKECANSHKIMEYLATGNMVLTSEIEAYAESDLVFTAYNEEDYLTRFKELMSNDCHDSSDLRGQRVAFAHSNTYEKHISTISSLLLE